MPPMSNPIRRIGQLSRIKLFVIVTLISATVWGLLAIGVFGMNTLTGLRGYVNGEGLWAKNQKDATQHLLRYLHSRDRADYNAFRGKLALIRGVERARIELEKDEPDKAIVLKGFEALGIHKDDHEPMTVVFRRFRHIEHMETAVEIWERGDRLIDELEALGERLHFAMAEPDYDLEEQFEARTLQILELNARLSSVEAEFSTAVGKAARWAAGLLVTVMVSFCIGASAVCALLAMLGARIIRKVESHARDLRDANDELVAQKAALETERSRVANQNLELRETRVLLIEKARALEQASKYKSEFLANMSHDLRTPLNSIVILSELLGENRECVLTEKQLEFARTIHDAGIDLQRLINDIMDLSRIEAGMLRFEVEEVALEEFLAGIERQFAPTADKRRLGFTVTREGDLPERMRIDPMRLVQIINNLLSNAFKFTEEGSVTLTVRRSPSPEIPEGTVFEVEDTGIGIAEDLQRSVFEAFRQADGATNRKHGGTGLGLTISHHLARLMGGTISLESREGEGSRFTLTVPADVDAAWVAESEDGSRYTSFSEENSEPDAEPAESRVAGEARDDTDCRHTGRVLVVDDDERSVFALRCILEEQDYCVLSAENGREALEVLEGRADVDLVLMDIMMPEMDGYEAIREIRSREEWKELPVIAVTAKAMKTDRMKCLDAGAGDYMAKPVDPTALLALVQRWLDGDATEMSA